MTRQQLLRVSLGVLILVIGTLFVPALLHQYRGISEVTPQEAAKRIARIKKRWWYRP